MAVMQGKVSPEEALELRRKLSASYIIAKKLESGLSPSGARTMQFSTRELEMGKLLGRCVYWEAYQGHGDDLDATMMHHMHALGLRLSLLVDSDLLVCGI